MVPQQNLWVPLGSGRLPSVWYNATFIKLYLDPMTGKEWMLIKDASQRIIGVASTSEADPIKKANFPFDLDPADFEGKKKYSEWQFICIHWPKPGTTGGGVKGLGTTTQSNMGQ